MIHKDIDDEDDFVRPICEEAQSISDKCDACGCRAWFVAELPRERHYQGKVTEVAPARFRLCATHATTLENNSQATIYSMRGQRQ